MKTLNYKELTTPELRDKIVEDKKLYDTMVFNHAVAPLENPLSIRISRRNIARLKTELKNRLLNESK
jgi:large subunit ribosomal protein L29